MDHTNTTPANNRQQSPEKSVTHRVLSYLVFSSNGSQTKTRTNHTSLRKTPKIYTCLDKSIFMNKVYIDDFQISNIIKYSILHYSDLESYQVYIYSTNEMYTNKKNYSQS